MNRLTPPVDHMFGKLHYHHAQEVSEEKDIMENITDWILAVGYMGLFALLLAMEREGVVSATPGGETRWVELADVPGGVIWLAVPMLSIISTLIINANRGKPVSVGNLILMILTSGLLLLVFPL